MKDSDKTKDQLLSELVELRRQTTESDRLKEQLRQANTFLRGILESSSSISIISTDLERNILYWNSGAENIFGYRAEEVVGRAKIDILYSDEHSKKSIDEIRGSILKTRKGASFESKEVTRDGHLRWIRMTVTPSLDEQGSVIGILGVGEDITERKRAEEELQDSLEKLRRSLEGIIQAMALTVEVRDPYTAGHQRRVTSLAVAMAKERGLSEERIDGLRYAGLLHDLGKIYVPAEILSKPGRLAEIEFSMIKRHCQVGYDILKNIEFPWPIAQIVLQHHERIDGSGYPAGLSSGEILLEAKILAVADVVEAMASHRPYRPALGVDKALEEISKNRGIHYDPEAVDICVRLFTEKGFKFE